ncbi:hypothetical protein [Cohnella zeiphila]|uniref:Uncharacterized protein n=1 Tax=Cohnella zeiphila TaxID=2761120 RepID=A0A7X0SLR9_9BACL|nr:hypothetical protein [Cohnella zeiphila]MBB6732229.1 hypothetical protein [Cohnella zeiphila]
MAEELERQTGWTVRFSPSIRQDQLVQLARTLLGPALTGNPSIHLQDRQLAVEAEPGSDWEAIQRQFQGTTGYRLTLKRKEGGAGSASASAEDGGTAALPPAGRQPMEVNRAQQEVKLWQREIAASRRSAAATGKRWSS